MNNSWWIAVVVMMIPAAGFAQTQIIPAASIQDRQLGWQAPYEPGGAKTPIKVDDKVYSAAQLSMADAFAEWIQASYVPRGGLGNVTVQLSPKLGAYSQNDAAKPQTYGAYAATYTDLKYDAGKKLVPATSGHLRWTITANAVEFGEPLMALNTPTDYYFLMPLFGEAITGSAEEDRTRSRYDLSKHPVVGRYITYFNYQMYSSRYSSSSNVLLCRDNKLPFVKVTKGEYLDRLAAAIERKYTAEKEADVKAWQPGPARTKIQAATDARYQKRIAALQGARAAYQGRLAEPAEVATLQPDVMLENNPDVFGQNRGPGRRHPVYKIDPAIAALAKSDRPQWVVVTWNGNIATDPVAIQLQDAILNNFDFDYLYDFVFNPEKVKGRPYQPRRSPTATAPAATSEPSAAVKTAASDPSVHFFDDFSRTPPGQKPTAWATGVAGLVTTLDGLPGHWAVMAGDHNLLTPRELTKPLPQDFTVSYDLVASRNFTWGARGLTFQLAREKSAGNADSYLMLRLRPGFDGRDGEATIETKFPAGYASGTQWVKAVGFSNDKTHNRVRVSVTKRGQALQVYIDGAKIAEYEKGVPADLRFNALSFIGGGNTGENDKFYVSNVTIKKE
jgi:hypothetical protein